MSTSGGGAGIRAPIIEVRSAPARDELDPSEIERFSFNHETGQPNIAEGIGIARADVALEGEVRLPDLNDLGVNFYIDDVPISLKGPLINGKSGADLVVTDNMIDGLAKAVLKDVRINTATNTIVIDTLNMSSAQRSSLRSAVEEGLRKLDNCSTKTLIILE